MENNVYMRKKEPELNKQLIIDAAIDIGSETNWHQVTFQAIADRTGLSKGGIIHHFRNKDELLDELLNQSLKEISAWIEQFKSDHKDTDAVWAYLNYVMAEKDEKYIKTMRIVLQAIFIDPKYLEQWEAWYSKNIMPEYKELPIKSLIIYLIAEGFWNLENIVSRLATTDVKKKVMDYIKELK